MSIIVKHFTHGAHLSGMQFSHLEYEVQSVLGVLNVNDVEGNRRDNNNHNVEI